VSRLVCVRTGGVLADRLEVARSVPERMRGLLGRRALPPGRGMLIERASSVHTFFMRFPLDLVFLDRTMTVTRVVHRLGPWRFAAARGARRVVELPAGTLERVPVQPGDRLRIEEGP